MPIEQPRTPETYKFRQILPEDWQKYRELWLRALQDTPAAFGRSYSAEVAKSERDWRESFADPERVFFAAEEEAKFVAVAGIRKASKDSNEEWMIVGVYTDPEHRGKGLSQNLIELCEEAARERGVKQSILMVNVDQEAAINMYKKLGYETAEQIKDAMMGDGLPHDEYLMKKELLASEESDAV